MINSIIWASWSMWRSRTVALWEYYFHDWLEKWKLQSGVDHDIQRSDCLTFPTAFISCLWIGLVRNLLSAKMVWQWVWSLSDLCISFDRSDFGVVSNSHSFRAEYIHWNLCTNHLQRRPSTVAHHLQHFIYLTQKCGSWYCLISLHVYILHMISDLYRSDIP